MAPLLLLTPAHPQVALVRQLLERRLPQLEEQQRQQRQRGAAATGGDSGAGEAMGEEQEEGQQQQQGVQVATVDSFQVSCATPASGFCIMPAKREKLCNAACHACCRCATQLRLQPAHTPAARRHPHMPACRARSAT